MNVANNIRRQQARTCDQLGVCQHRAIPCLDCTRQDAPAWDTDEVTCTPFEVMWYWIGMTLLVAGSLCVVVGGSSYLYHRFF